jgi:phenylpropionate dioxygenase-like ring-hydroxylating dioxygenase large terminal subunit
MARRFPFPIPFGWFCVAVESDLAPGDVTATKYFGADLVVWRDDAGEFHVNDAYCPHLGAHLGIGGTVHGGELACPFHGWSFDGDGACTNIPYSERVNKKAKLRAYPVIVRNRFVFAWYHPRGVEPQWDLPQLAEVGDPAWTDYYSSSYIIKTIPQEMSENGVDPAHFKFVHGTDTVAEMLSYDSEGPLSTMLSRQSYVTPKGVEWGRIDVYNHGPGYSQVYFEIPGLVDAWNIATTSPIDDDTTHVRFNFVVQRHESAEFTDTIANAFVNEINKQVSEDAPIWENKAFLPVPALADTDGPILKFRKWYSQFYAEPVS